ncbi:MAG TPA: 4'-phosphopantetheinyl transferase superfamily protein [Pyrinomonadaceae bacterium]
MHLYVNTIDLWYTFIDEITEELLDSYLPLLSDDERKQHLRFVFERDRRRYLVTRALVRTVLSRYVDVPPAEWNFAANAYGRPEIMNEHDGVKDLSFNLAHTNRLVMLGITFGRAIGVDTECFGSREAPLEIVDRFFAPTEIIALKALPKEDQSHRFFEYWTLKESYIKARAMGLSLPLDKFSFELQPAITLAIDSELSDSPSRWWFRQFTIEDHLVAVCAERVGDHDPQLVLKRTVPLRIE